MRRTEGLSMTFLYTMKDHKLQIFDLERKKLISRGD